MNVKDTISHIIDTWFMYEPLLFNVYCTHKLEENKEMQVPFRTGKRMIQYNPVLLDGFYEKEIEALLKIEVTRIILKHPYQRMPRNPNRPALTTASDITISEHCFTNKNLKNARYYNFENNLSYEEYYSKLYYICPNIIPSDADSSEEDQTAPGEYLSAANASGVGSGLESDEDSENQGTGNKSNGKNGVNAEDPSEETEEQMPGNGRGKRTPNQTLEEKYQDAANASELWDDDEEICDSINQQIEKAQKTNQWGSISGDFQETITASMRIPMDYRRILSQFRANIISQRRKLTRMKPNRRYGFEFMGSKFEPKTKLLVAVDVSGSIESEDLQHFFSIINRFFSYGVELIQVVAFDTEIKQEFELKKATKNIKICGRGGTDFQCAIDYYENHPEYQGLVLFSDGYASVPVVKKHKQMVWILTGKEEYEVAYRWIKSLKGSKATWIPSVGKRR